MADIIGVIGVLIFIVGGILFLIEHLKKVLFGESLAY
jgi:hypothetical protein